MPRKPATHPYTCARCNYTSYIRNSAYRHLYQNIKKCINVNNIELTDEIKSTILESRIYYPPQNITIISPIVNATTNGNVNNGNVNNINNLIVNIDTVDKLTEFIQYLKLPLIGHDESIQMKHMNAIELLNNPSSTDQHISKCDNLSNIFDNDFMKMINNSTILQKKDANDNIVHMNIIYDTVSNCIKIYRDDEWNTYNIDDGLNCIIDGFKINYLDYYEKYLIKKIHTNSDRKLLQIKYTTQLSNYYKFLVYYELSPFVEDTSNEIILDTINDKSHDISMEYMDLYDEIKIGIKKSHIKKARKELLSIIKNCSESNNQELDRKILGLIEIDAEFKTIFNNTKAIAI